MSPRAPRPRRSAHERALDALALRPRAAQELARWLRDRGYDAAEVAAVVERLTAAGLLDDARFAEAFARSRLIDRRLSRRRVLAELARRGVGREVASAAVASVVADEGVDEREAAYLVAEKKYRSLAGLDPAVAARRLTGFLARRGYGQDAIQGAVRRLLAG
ncbi:MAG: regulatory protein RecX [Gemmatimonadaceae bacterium]|nr:regulatory protein RecX [Gemmatimonadaceae bacterium]